MSGLLLLPVVLTADIGYRGQNAGDEAFRKEDYSSAASFYKEYQEAARRSGDAAAECSAMERRIDALILGKLPEEARKVLQEYKRKFPGRDSVAVAIWSADIDLLQNNPGAAKGSLEKILGALTADNPRRTHALFSLARAYELSGNYSGASEIYYSIGQDQPKGFLWQKAIMTKVQVAAWERGIFCQAFTPKAKNAFQALEKHPEFKLPAAQPRIQLLRTFLELMTVPKEEIPAVWKKYKVLDSYKDNEMSYPVFSSIGDLAVKNGFWDVAAEAYSTAYNCSPGKKEAFETLNRLILVIHSSGKKEEAAEFALNVVKMFRGGYISVNFLEEIAGILYNAGKFSDSAHYYTELVKKPEVSEKTKHQGMLALVRISAKIKLPEIVLSLLDQYFTGTKAGERSYLYAETLLTDKKYAEAAKKFLQTAEKFPEWRVKSLYQAAYARSVIKRYDSVLATLDLLIMQKNLPQQIITDATYLRARAYEGTGKNAAAWREYEKYSLRPGCTEVYAVESLLRGGRLAFQVSETNKAIHLLERLIREFPKSPKSIEAANWRIYIYRSVGDHYRADRATYELAYAWPDSQATFNAMYLLAENNFSTDSYNKVMGIFEDLFHKSSTAENKSRVLIGQASLAVYHKKYVEAGNFLDQLEKNYPENPFKAKTAYLRAHIAHAAGKYADAIVFYKKVLTLTGDIYLLNASHGSLGDCYFILAGKTQNMQTYDAALLSYQQVLKAPSLDPGLHAMSLYKTGRTFEMKGMDDAALDHYKKVLYLPAAFNTPASRLWAAKSAEAIYSIAEKRPVKTHIDSAYSALRLLEEFQIIPTGSAEKRIENLRKSRLRTRNAK